MSRVRKVLLGVLGRRGGLCVAGADAGDGGVTGRGGDAAGVGGR
ncbi:MAG: hypothetical protein U0232_20730 [Thermomicrobiales bacterium]